MPEVPTIPRPFAGILTLASPMLSNEGLLVSFVWAREWFTHNDCWIAYSGEEIAALIPYQCAGAFAGCEESPVENHVIEGLWVVQ